MASHDGVAKGLRYNISRAAGVVSGGLFGYEKDKDGNPVADAYGNPKLKAPTFGAAMQKILDPLDFKNAGKHLADGFLKSLNNLSAASGLDKTIKGMKDIFEGGVTFKGGVFGKPKAAEGDKLTSELHEKSEANAQARAKKLEDQNTALLKAIENLTQSTTRELKNLGTKFTSTKP